MSDCFQRQSRVSVLGLQTYVRKCGRRYERRADLHVIDTFFFFAIFFFLISASMNSCWKKSALYVTVALTLFRPYLVCKLFDNSQLTVFKFSLLLPPPTLSSDHRPSSFSFGGIAIQAWIGNRRFSLDLKEQERGKSQWWPRLRWFSFEFLLFLSVVLVLIIVTIVCTDADRLRLGTLPQFPTFFHLLVHPYHGSFLELVTFLLNLSLLSCWINLSGLPVIPQLGPAS